MRLWKYLWNKRLLILLYIFNSIFIGTIIFSSEEVRLSDSYGVYIIVVSLLVFGVYLAVDFSIKKNYFKQLLKISHSIQLDWVDLLPMPVSEEQRIYTELLKKLYNEAYLRLDEYSVKSSEDIEFITIWVHEIKTPIAASKLIVENSMNNPTERVLYSLEDEIDKIEDYVQMALYYSRANDFAKDYIINTVSIEKVVKDCIRREYSSITCKRLNLRVENDGQVVDTDEKWLGFIVKQLLDNAIKYSLPDGEIHIYTEKNDKETILNIRDFGVGIKREDLSRVFDKNFTGYNGRSLYNSTGLGLYLCQKLAIKLGHRVTVESEFENGTRASVHFPKWNDYFIDETK